MRIKVTGYMDIHDDQFDPGPKGPLTEAAWLEISNDLGLEDIEFEVANVQ
jgi:hypothetical protein